MPIYEYRCQECQQIFEEWQKDFKDREVPCPVCNGNSQRLISNTSFVLKGSGWYVTDYCNRGSTASTGTESSGNGNGASAEKKKSTKKEAKSSSTESSPAKQPNK